MASVTFSPEGTQLDNDEIADIQVNEGDRLGFNFTLDTSRLDAELKSLKLQLQGDSSEVNLSDTLTDFFGTTFPDVAVVEDNSDGDFISVVVELKGEPGATPDIANVLVESEATVGDSLVNDGATDIGVTVLEAIDANGNDVTNLFEPVAQVVDLQSIPPIQAVFGTEKSEPIIGTPQNDLIQGEEGNDLFIDLEGDDNSFGGEGNDVFLDDAGNDTIVGGAGNDFVNADSDNGGDDVIDLGTGNNFALGGAGADTFVLNRDSIAMGIGDFTPGEDRFALGENLTKDNLSFAQLNNDGLGLLNGSTIITNVHTGKPIAFVGLASAEAVSNAEFIDAEDVLPTDDLLSTDEQNPEPIQAELPEAQSGDIFGTPNPDILVGDDGTNLILAGGANNFVNAGSGDDQVFGEDDIDIFNGEAGNDLLNGSAGGDVLNGGEGNDTLLAEIGSDDAFDILNGDDGNDLLVGGADSDAIGGGQGDDLIFGGGGNDGLFGNEGHDTFAFASGEGADIIFDFEPEQDAIALKSCSSYDSLNIEYNAQGNYTNVSEETGELIATLLGVEADQITESNFTTI